MEDAKCKVSDHVRVSKYKNTLAKVYVLVWRIFLIKKVKNTVPWPYVVEILERFTKKNCKKQIKKSLELKKKSTEKVITYIGKWKGYDNSFNSWINKKISLYQTSYLPEPYTRHKITKSKLDFSNYATKSDSKSATGVYTSYFAKKSDLVSLKSVADKLDIGKLETSPIDLCKLSDVVKN